MNGAGDGLGFAPGTGEVSGDGIGLGVTCIPGLGTGFTKGAGTMPGPMYRRGVGTGCAVEGWGAGRPTAGGSMGTCMGSGMFPPRDRSAPGSVVGVNSMNPGVRGGARGAATVISGSTTSGSGGAISGNGSMAGGAAGGITPGLSDGGDLIGISPARGREA